MKQSIIRYSAAFVIFCGACDSIGVDPTPAAPKAKLVTTEEEAKMAFSAVRSFWLSTVKPTLPKQNVTVNKQVSGGGGTSSLTGSVKYTKSGSSSSVYESIIMDITSSFGQGFETSSVTMAGSARFYDSYSYESRCSSTTCASSTKNRISIGSAKLTVEFVYQGQKIKDDITIDAYKEFTSWDVTVKNSSGVAFDWFGG